MCGQSRILTGMTGGFFPVVVEEFLRQGFTSADIAKIGARKASPGLCGRTPSPAASDTVASHNVVLAGKAIP